MILDLLTNTLLEQKIIDVESEADRKTFERSMKKTKRWNGFILEGGSN